MKKCVSGRQSSAPEEYELHQHAADLQQNPEHLQQSHVAEDEGQGKSE